MCSVACVGTDQYILNLQKFSLMKYFVPVLYRMAAKVKKSAGPSTKIGKWPGQG